MRFFILTLLVLFSLVAALVAGKKGDSQLRDEFQRAFATAVEHGDWEATIGSEPNFFLPGDCLDDATMWPGIGGDTPTGVWKEILDRGSIRVAYPGITSTSLTGIVMFDWTTSPPSGAMPDLLDTVAGYMGGLNVEWSICPTSDECFSALNNGTLDFLPLYWSIAGSYESVARSQNFAVAHCISNVQPSVVWVRSNSNIDTKSELVAVGGSRIGTVGFGAGQSLEGKLGVTGIVIYDSNDLAFDALIDSDIDAVYLGAPPPQYASSVKIFADQTAIGFSSSTSFFRACSPATSLRATLTLPLVASLCIAMATFL